MGRDLTNPLPIGYTEHTKKEGGSIYETNI